MLGAAIQGTANRNGEHPSAQDQVTRLAVGFDASHTNERKKKFDACTLPMVHTLPCPEIGACAALHRPHLIESLLSPSQQIAEGYRTSLVVMDDGRSYSGIAKSRDEQQLTLVDALSHEHEIELASVEQLTEAVVSLMPTGLADALSPQEFTNLVAYLETRRTGKASFGSGVSGPIGLPEGFEIRMTSGKSDRFSKIGTTLPVCFDG